MPPLQGRCSPRRTAKGRAMAGETASLRVYYIRHGQSQWNAAQSRHRREEMPEEQIKALGRQEYFTDSPLSQKGVEQALALQQRAPEWPLRSA